MTITPSSPLTEWAKDAYYRFVFNVTVSGNKNKKVTFSEAKFYKNEVSGVESLSITTAPSKLNYKVGETLDLTGLVLDADGTAVSSGYTASPANGSTLNTVGAQTVTISYGGQTATQVIHVGALQSIAITTAPTKTDYNEGQTFDPTGMVVKATFSDEEDTPTTWQETLAAGEGGYTYSPSTALAPANTSVTISYTWNEVEKTTTQAITVNAATAYTVTFNAGTGSCATSSLTEASGLAGVTLPTATIGVSGWSFAGWATSSVTNTTTKPTIYAASSTYHPTENCTLYAVYNYFDGDNSKLTRATSVDQITSAEGIAVVNSGKILKSDFFIVNAPTEDINNQIAKAADNYWTLTGDNTTGFTLKCGDVTLGAGGLTNAQIENSTTHSKWIFDVNTTDDNMFVLRLADSPNKACIEYYSSDGKWKVYTSGASFNYKTNTYVACKIYTLAKSAYNSNPAAIVNPTVAFTTATDKTLYMHDGSQTYDNAANVTGIAKTATYTSSDATVATVSEEGVVTALKSGTTTITATVAAELGVNTEATATYTVTVKDASTVAGLKAITSSATVVAFTADLTDAVVTYVKGSHAFIQDASGAVYASCGSSLTAGNKINGAVSGSIKASNQIDEITAITLTAATVTEDGVIPAAAVKTAAELAAEKADLEGKLVRITGATITASLSGASGGKISDDNKTTEINLYAPDGNITAEKDAEGTFNGYITLYGGSSIRFNIFEQSQIVLTKNAPTAQPLSFESDAVELDEETDAFTAFAGQTVSGAEGTVTYAMTGDAIGSVNTTTGVVTLNGTLGTATVTATAAAKEVTVDGVTTPYTATNKSYTITVYPRYTVTFNVNGVADARRQAAHGAAVEVPTPAAVGDFAFMGWNNAAIAFDKDNDEPAGLTALDATITPDANATYYAVFARATVGDDELVELYKNEGATGTVNGITASGTTNGNNGNPKPGFNMTATVTLSGIDLTGYKAPTTLTFDYKAGKSGSSFSKITIAQLDADSKQLTSSTIQCKEGEQNKYTTCDAISLDLACKKITITVTTVTSNCFIDNILIKATKSGITYVGYTTTVPAGDVTLAEDNDSEEDYTYATFSADEDVVFTSDVTVFAVSVSGDRLVKTELETGDYQITDESYESGAVEGGYYVKAGNGVMLRSTANTKIAYYYPTTEQKAEPNPDVPAGNLLIAGTGTTPVDSDHKYYKLTYENALKENFGFYWGAAEGAPFLLKKGKAYLKVSKSTSARSFMLDDEDGMTTGIRSLTPAPSPKGEGSIYTLSGQKVQNPKKGLYIVNGRKVLVP